jgi:predicted MFS family arabinose efflux permease
MKLFARLFRLVWGGDVDRALRPVLAVSLVGAIAGSSAFTYIGIWAIKDLHAPQASLGLAYLGGALLSLLLGYVGGHWSDKVGRRPLILLGWGTQAIVPLALLAVGHRATLGLVLLAVLPAVGSLGGAADQAMIADLVAPERHESAYASVRVASNLGVAIGPAIGGLLLVGGHWSHLWVGTFILAAAGFAIAWRYIPRGGAYAPEAPPTRGSFGVIIRDAPFLLFMLFGIAAQMTYVATETLLPISVTTTHHLAPAAWGFLMILNPISVTLFQLRLTRRTASIPPSVKLAAAMPMMGAPFLLLDWNGSAAMIALVIAIFVTGEMLWVPSSQAVVAALAPADIRGAYMGAFSGTGSIGFALTPFLGLAVRHAYGDAAMWWCVAGIGVTAGFLGFAAARGHDAEAAVASATS